MERIENLGFDAVSVERFRRLPYGDHSHFYQRVFSDREISYCLGFKDFEKHFAGNFAAKEAVRKTLGDLKIGLWDIEIKHNQHGRPFVRFNRKVSGKVLVSVSYAGEYALAFAYYHAQSGEKG